MGPGHSCLWLARAWASHRALVLRAQNLVGRSMCREQLAHLVPPRRTQLSVPSSDMGIRYLMII